VNLSRLRAARSLIAPNSRAPSTLAAGTRPGLSSPSLIGSLEISPSLRPLDSGVEFVAVDNPHANELTIHILAAVAEHEREAISERTKAALAATKARGKRLGTPPDPAGPSSACA
jgi:hypothetical protein